jgi:hypothetical protein
MPAAKTAATSLPHRSSRKQAIEHGTRKDGFSGGVEFEPCVGLPKAIAGREYDNKVDAAPIKNAPLKGAAKTPIR